MPQQRQIFEFGERGPDCVCFDIALRDLIISARIEKAGSQIQPLKMLKFKKRFRRFGQSKSAQVQKARFGLFLGRDPLPGDFPAFRVAHDG